MNDDKKSFVLYIDNLTSLERCSDEQAGKVFKAIVHHQITGEKREFEDVAVDILLDRIYPNLEENEKKWNERRQQKIEAGRIGGLKRAENLSKLSKAGMEDKTPKLTVEKMIEAFPFNLFPEDHKEPICNWIRYQFGRKKIKNEMTIASLGRSLLRKLEAGKDIPKAIDDTIANPNWQGLTFVDEDKYNKQKPVKKTMRDVNDKTEQETIF